MADYGIKRYRLGASLFKRALLDGFEIDENSLRTNLESKSVCNAFLSAIDSAEPDCMWGRLSISCTMAPESMLTVRVFASDQNEIIRNDRVIRVDDFLLDPEIPREEKEKLFTLAGGIERSCVRDLLLDGQNGRWLWLWLEASGTEDISIGDMRIYVPGDNFFGTLPQVYRSENDFLRRYISVFSTIYQEFQEKIDALPEILDVDTAPLEMLPVLASWLGLETDEAVMSEDDLRRILKIAPELMSHKGTKWAIERVVNLFVTEKVYVVESNLLNTQENSADNMYGKTPYDFTVMVGCGVDEKLRLKLKFLIDQFKPIRSRYKIVFLQEYNGMDSFTYLDVNSAMAQNTPGTLDDGKALTGTTYLQ